MKKFIFILLILLAVSCGKSDFPTGNKFIKNTSEGVRCTVNDVSFDFVYVQGGTFTMGATPDQGSEYNPRAEPAHQVTLSDYYIGKFEVTQQLWRAVMKTRPSQSEGENNPVEQVNWKQCQDFVETLNLLTGLSFALPTEAQWEYAARGGNKSKGYMYSGSNNINEVAWNDENQENYLSFHHPVGMKLPNELGIYDMSGNVSEWCHDYYADYSASAQTDPQGPSEGHYRVCRGGDFTASPTFQRVSFRFFHTPDTKSMGLGLRLVLLPDL